MRAAGPARARRVPRRAADEPVLSVAALVRVDGPVHLVVGLRGEDASGHAVRAHLRDQRLEGARDLVAGARVHLHLDRHRAVPPVSPEAKELDLPTHAAA